jgi:hypothetical protein
MADPYTPTEERIVAAYIAALSMGTDEADRDAREEAQRGIAQIKMQAAAAAHVEFQAQMNASLPSIVKEMRAQGWDQGRASIAADLTNPMQEDGTRQTTPNPYRDPIPTTRADDT